MRRDGGPVLQTQGVTPADRGLFRVFASSSELSHGDYRAGERGEDERSGSEVPFVSCRRILGRLPRVGDFHSFDPRRVSDYLVLGDGVNDLLALFELVEIGELEGPSVGGGYGRGLDLRAVSEEPDGHAGRSLMLRVGLAFPDLDAVELDLFGIVRVDDQVAVLGAAVDDYAVSGGQVDLFDGVGDLGSCEYLNF